MARGRIGLRSKSGIGYRSGNVCVVRHKAESPDHPWMLVVDPLLQIWEGARSPPIAHAVSFLIWIWVPLVLFRLVGRMNANPPSGQPTFSRIRQPVSRTFQQAGL